MRKAIIVFVLVLGLSGCGYNGIQQQDETVKSAWSEVLNQYQRRSDLVPQLVATVKGYAAHEKEVLLQVTNARSKAGSVQLSASQLPNEQQLQQFSQAQGELTSALGRLNVVLERYPNLKANEAFTNLQTQLEGNENRITHARRQYIEAVRQFNTTIRQFPVNLTAKLFSYKPVPNFSVGNAEAISHPPKVEF
ncbi:MAG: LemA family protein [Neisseriaceae bacterium]